MLNPPLPALGSDYLPLLEEPLDTRAPLPQAHRPHRDSYILKHSMSVESEVDHTKHTEMEKENNVAVDSQAIPTVEGNSGGDDQGFTKTEVNEPEVESGAGNAEANEESKPSPEASNGDGSVPQEAEVQAMDTKAEEANEATEEVKEELPNEEEKNDDTTTGQTENGDTEAVKVEEPQTETSKSDDVEVDHEKKVQEFMKNDEEIKHFSDDEISIEGSSSDSDSDSSSESSSSSDSSDSELDCEEDNQQGDDLDDEEEASGGPIVSKNEMDEKAFSLPEDYKVPENAPLEFVGNLTSLVEKNAIVKANISGEFRVLKDQSVLCFEDRLVLGPLFETFGKLQAPHYRVKFNTDEEFNALKERKGEKVFYVVPESQFIYTDAIKKLKGTDASNCHDEELPEEEQEFSDDEQELAAKQRKKKKKKAKDSKDGPQPKKQNTNPEPNKFTSYGFAPSQTSYAGLPRVPPRNNQYNRQTPPVQQPPIQAQQPPIQAQQQSPAYGSPNPYGVPISHQQQYAPNPYQGYQQQGMMPQVPQYQQPQTPYGYGQPYWPQGQPQVHPQMYPQPTYQQPQQPPPNYQIQQQQIPQPQQQPAPQQANALYQLHALVANQLNQQVQNPHTQHPPQGPPQ